jgi:hypothetical protein
MFPDSRQFDAALGLWRELRAAGYEALLAGGCVRDLLLGREPKDFDVATSATPDVVLGLFPRTFAVGAHLGWCSWPTATTRASYGGGDVPVGRGLFGWAASGCGAVYDERRGGCEAAGFHDQWAAAGSR